MYQINKDTEKIFENFKKNKTLMNKIQTVVHPTAAFSIFLNRLKFVKT